MRLHSNVLQLQNQHIKLFASSQPVFIVITFGNFLNRVYCFNKHLIFNMKEFFNWKKNLNLMELTEMCVEALK